MGAAQRELLCEVQGTFRLLFSAVALVLLIACTNVTNLLRRKEVAMRASIGWPRRQLVLVDLVSPGRLCSCRLRPLVDQCPWEPR